MIANSLNIFWCEATIDGDTYSSHYYTVSVEEALRMFAEYLYYEYGIKSGVITINDGYHNISRYVFKSKKVLAFDFNRIPRYDA